MDSKAHAVFYALCVIWVVLCFVLIWKSKRNILLFKSVLHEDRCPLLCIVSVDVLRKLHWQLDQICMRLISRKKMYIYIYKNSMYFCW